ncbi:MAG: hypothetical protein WB791_05055 [Waddliaceae bacterium]
MLKRSQFRLDFSGIIILLYFLPTFLLSVLPFNRLGTLFFGFFLSCCGSTVIFFLLRQWEGVLSRGSTATPTESSDPFHSKENFQELEKAFRSAQEKYQELKVKFDQAIGELETVKKEQEESEHQIQRVNQELKAYQSTSEEETKRKTVILSEYQETINQQREVIEKKQKTISEQEGIIRDLNYEVKTLLQLAEMTKDSPEESEMEMEGNETIASYPSSKASGPHSQVKLSEDASSQLKRCIDIAQKITGSSHFGKGNSRFKDLPIDHYALDLRRLFDSLHSENACTVFVYSQKENRLIFANHQTKHLLGWSPEKFIQNFPQYIEEGEKEWKESLNLLSTHSEAALRLLMKTRTGQNVLVHCNLGVIPTGIFRRHVIGVLYPA